MERDRELLPSGRQSLDGPPKTYVLYRAHRKSLRKILRKNRTKVPKGRLNLAQDEILGLLMKMSSPEGTAEISPG
jgi:hypothetical protein